jgi:hypothetical protein
MPADPGPPEKALEIHLGRAFGPRFALGTGGEQPTPGSWARVTTPR